MELTLEQMQVASRRRHGKEPLPISNKQADILEMRQMEWVLRLDMKMLSSGKRNPKPAKKTPQPKKLSKRARNKVDFDRIAAAAARLPR